MVASYQMGAPAEQAPCHWPAAAVLVSVLAALAAAAAAAAGCAMFRRPKTGAASVGGSLGLPPRTAAMAHAVGQAVSPRPNAGYPAGYGHLVFLAPPAAYAAGPAAQHTFYMPVEPGRTARSEDLEHGVETSPSAAAPAVPNLGDGAVQRAFDASMASVSGSSGGLDALEAALDAMHSTQTQLHGGYTLLSSRHRRSGPVAVLQLAERRPAVGDRHAGAAQPRDEVAFDFFLSQEAFERERRLHHGPQSPYRQVHAFVDNAAGDVRAPDGSPLPSFAVLAATPELRRFIASA